MKRHAELKFVNVNHRHNNCGINQQSVVFAATVALSVSTAVKLPLRYKLMYTCCHWLNYIQTVLLLC